MNHLVLWKDLRLFYGNHSRSIKVHSHPVIQLVLATNGTFVSKNLLGEWVPKNGLLIAPNVPHECDAHSIPLISMDIDPESGLGEWILSNQLQKKQIVDYPSNDIRALDTKIFLDYLRNEDWNAVRTMIATIFKFKKEYQIPKKDLRIREVLDFITGHIQQNISTAALADVACLSTSRLQHLFKEVMGLPIRNYILWHRLQIAMEMVLKGQSLTAASHSAGFSDQAHMTRTFTKMLGIPPSLIVKNSKFVQVSILK